MELRQPTENTVLVILPRAVLSLCGLDSQRLKTDETAFKNNRLYNFPALSISYSLCSTSTENRFWNKNHKVVKIGFPSIDCDKGRYHRIPLLSSLSLLKITTAHSLVSPYNWRKISTRVFEPCRIT